MGKIIGLHKMTLEELRTSRKIMIDDRQERKVVLKRLICEDSGTIADFCKLYRFHFPAFQKKLNGETEFSLDEIQRIVSALNLTGEETERIFFGSMKIGTVKELSILIGVNERTYRNWERMVTHPTMEQAKQICNIYNISIDLIHW